MEIKLYLAALNVLVRSLDNPDDVERLKAYGAIMVILREIEASIKEKPIPNYTMYKGELLSSCRGLCKLTDGGGHDERNLMTWALSAVNKLKSVHCFNV